MHAWSSVMHLTDHQIDLVKELETSKEESDALKGKAKYNDGSMAMSAIARFQKSNFLKRQDFKSFKGQRAINVSTVILRYCNKSVS